MQASNWLPADGMESDDTHSDYLRANEDMMAQANNDMIVESNDDTIMEANDDTIVPDDDDEFEGVEMTDEMAKAVYGATWGTGLFECDKDLEIVYNLSTDAGLNDLQREANKPLSSNSSMTNSILSLTNDVPSLSGTTLTNSSSDSDHNLPHADHRGNEHCYSLYPEFVSREDDKQFVRNHLDSGALNKLINQWHNYALQEARMHPDQREYPSAEYHLILIGACAMSWGCQLHPAFLEILRRLLYNLQDKQKALEQLSTALDDPRDSYKNDGTPYDFQSDPFFEDDDVRQAALAGLPLPGERGYDDICDSDDSRIPTGRPRGESSAPRERSPPTMSQWDPSHPEFADRRAEREENWRAERVQRWREELP